MSKNLSILSNYPDYEVVIGIETHVQLKTKSKLFCGCQNVFGSSPNTNICRVCTGMLGSLPVLNLQAINYAITAGLGLNCDISRVSEFARKHYMYPDLPKNYQISQDDKPLCLAGYLNIGNESDSSLKKIRITRIHVEEDAGKLLHGDGLDSSKSFIDLNRAGTPLIEIVTEPDIKSADEAVAYLENLKSIVEYLQIGTANMEEGSFRADVNISVKKKDTEKLGTKVELKNINSFKFIHSAIEHEIERQIELIESGKKVFQETRLWDSQNHQTIFMRSKENSQDYKYLTDPDLPLLIIDEEWISRIKEQLPELPREKFARLSKEYGLTSYDASLLSSDRELADYFEVVAKKSNAPKKAANWILRDLLGFLKESKLSISESLVTPEMFGEFILEIERGIINSSIAREVFEEMTISGKYPSIIIQEKGLEQVGNVDELMKFVNTVIQENPSQVADYKSGNPRIFGFLVGQAMKVSAGKADPKMLTKLLQEALK